jgi:hypothetical protein
MSTTKASEAKQVLADEFFKKAHDHCKFSGKYYQLRRDEKDGEPGNPQACDAWISYFHHKGWDKVARWAKHHLNNGGCVTVPEIMPQRFDYECPEFQWNPEKPRHMDMSRLIKKTSWGARTIPQSVRANIADMAEVSAALGYDGSPKNGL